MGQDDEGSSRASGSSETLVWSVAVGGTPSCLILHGGVEVCSTKPRWIRAVDARVCEAGVVMMYENRLTPGPHTWLSSEASLPCTRANFQTC